MEKEYIANFQDDSMKKLWREISGEELIFDFEKIGYSILYKASGSELAILKLIRYYFGGNDTQIYFDTNKVTNTWLFTFVCNLMDGAHDLKRGNIIAHKDDPEKSISIIKDFGCYYETSQGGIYKNDIEKNYIIKKSWNKIA